MKAKFIVAGALWAGLYAAPAAAAPFAFPNGDKGFLLTSVGEAGCPCDFAASFGPDSDVGTPSGLDLASPTAPTLFNPTGAGAYRIQFTLLGALDDKIGLPTMPDLEGLTSFRYLVGDHAYDVSLRFGPGLVSNWKSFSGRTSPPGASFGATFDWSLPDSPAARGISPTDAFVKINVAYDGRAVSYASAPAPEPQAWALMIAGLGLVGSAMRRRRALAA